MCAVVRPTLTIYHASVYNAGIMSEQNGHISGGQGGVYDMPSKSDNARLERKALRRRWPITDTQRELMLERQVTTALFADSNRESTNAFKAILAAEHMDDQL